MEWRERFERLVTRKTGEAAGARLSRYTTDFAAPEDDVVALATGWTEPLFDGPFYMARSSDTRRPACSLVFVQSLDGNTVAEDPSELGGGVTDKHLIYEGLSRVAADAVMAGAETAKGGDMLFSVWHPEFVRLREDLGLPRHPTQIVATVRGIPIERMLMCNVPGIPVIVLTVSGALRQMQAAADARPWITLLSADREDELPGAFRHLRARGISRISCVGGRTLASRLLEARLVDDVYLTTSARKGGAPGTPISFNPWRGRVVVRKLGTGVEAGVIFEHVLTR